MIASRPLRVLFICTGNTCRTPMAEALLRRLFDESETAAEVRSAGTHALEGAPAHPDARAVAAEAGLDLSSHHATLLTDEVVRWADIVLGMSPAHVQRARSLDAAAEVRLMTEFDPAGPHGRGIQDPMGHEREVYEEVFEEIRSCLEHFVERHSGSIPSGADG